MSTPKRKGHVTKTADHARAKARDLIQQSPTQAALAMFTALLIGVLSNALIRFGWLATILGAVMLLLVLIVLSYVVTDKPHMLDTEASESPLLPTPTSRRERQWGVALIMLPFLLLSLGAGVLIGQHTVQPILATKPPTPSAIATVSPTSLATLYPPTVPVGPGTPSPTPYSGGGNPPPQGGISPTSSSKPTPPPTPTPNPRPTATQGTGWPYTGTPFFADSLTADDGHWYITTNDSNYSCKFVSGGGYQASSNNYVGVPCNFLNQQFTNVAFQADFSFVSGGPTRGAALTVDDDTDGSFYEFAIEANGNYLERIYHQTTVVRPDPISGYITYNSNQKNTLGVILNNHVLEMYLNGTLIASHPDSSLSQGFISVESYSENGQQATVSFTNARVWEP